MWSLENETSSDSSEEEYKRASPRDSALDDRDDQGREPQPPALPSFSVFDDVERPSFLSTASKHTDAEEPRWKFDLLHDEGSCFPV